MRDDDRARRAHEDDAKDMTRRTVGTADAGGATTGAHAGAVLGAAAGPAGIVAGGTLGGIAGWLAGSQVRDAPDLSEAEEERYRRMHDGSEQADTVPFEHVRDLYRLGHHMGEEPQFASRRWQDIEPELREAWTAVQRETWGDWPEAAPYVQRGYEDRAD